MQRLDRESDGLLQVHGVDFYAGIESFDPLRPEMPPLGTPLHRCPRPEEGEQEPEAEGGSHLGFRVYHHETALACESRPESDEGLRGACLHS